MNSMVLNSTSASALPRSIQLPGAKFVVAFGAGPMAILLIAWVRETTGSLELLFLGLAATSVVITLVALLLPGNERSVSLPVPQAAPAE